MKKIRQETHRTTHPLHTKAPWLVLALTLALGNAALGVTRYVAVSGNDANTPYTTWAAPAETIAAAISVATDGDVILVSNGVYTLSSVLTITNAITLRSANGPESTIINAGGVRRAFWIGNVSGATLAGFTITNGYHNILGAGIDMYSGDNLISNCIVRGNHTGPSGIGGGIYFGRNSSGRAVDTLVEGNTAFKGAGILFTNSAASISNCTVIQNQAGIHGGGVYICGDGAVLHSLISENSAFDGGGIYCTGSTAWITGNTISSNVAQRDGAGAYLDFGGTLSNCMITGNAAGTNGFGGGVCIFSSGLVVDSTVAGNNAGFDGGGIYCWEGGHVRNSTIEGNTVDGDGAGIYVYNSTPSATTSSVSSITNCLIQNNACSGFYIGYGRGGGVVLNGDGKVVGSTIQNNQATDAGGGVFIVNCPGAINAADVRGLIDNTAVLANRALRGGGIWAVGGTVRSCTVIDNA
ncbi:MAG: hypothetical protein EOM20_21150, partial [Spartobacteria bacterium]|nr:hypothetical protein [Spartobacteria bacterium]